MYLLIVALIGAAVFNSDFFQFGVGSVNVLTVFIVLSGAVYLLMHIYNKKRGEKYKPSNKCDRYLVVFLGWGVLVAVASYEGLYSLIPTIVVAFDVSYIPRQAYYLFFLPLIILAGRHVQTPALLGMLCRCYRHLFFAIYAAYVFVNKTLAIDVPCFFCLSLLLLMGRDRRKAFDLAMLLLIMLSPVDVGGEMTQIILRMLLLFFYFAPEGAGYMRPAVVIAVCVILACYVIPFIPLDWIGMDANTSWRMRYWGDELTQLMNSFGLGVGYGTSYATNAFIGEAVSGPFAATAEYTVAERMYVVGCHNSFISIAFRLGILGAGFLLLFILSISQRALPKDRSNYLVYSLLSSLVIVCFNVGFESPVYFFSVAFAFAAVRAMTEERITRASFH